MKRLKLRWSLRLGMVFYRGIPILPLIDLKLTPLENWLGILVVILMGLFLGLAVGNYVL